TAGNALDDLQSHVGGAQRQLSAGLRTQQDVGENGNCGSPLDDALYMAQRLEKGGPFDGELHGECTEVCGLDGVAAGPPRAVRERPQTGSQYSMEAAPNSPNRRDREGGREPPSA